MMKDGLQSKVDCIAVVAKVNYTEKMLDIAKLQTGTRKSQVTTCMVIQHLIKLWNVL